MIRAVTYIPLVLLLALSLATLAAGSTSLPEEYWCCAKDDDLDLCYNTKFSPCIDGFHFFEEDDLREKTCAEVKIASGDRVCKRTVEGSGGGDPVFNGFMGHKFYVAGYNNASFAILSMPGHQINGHLSTGLEDDAGILYFDAMGVKVGDILTMTLEMCKDDKYAKGEPIYQVTVNGQDLSNHLGSHTYLEYDSGTSVLFFDSRFDSNKSRTDNNGVEGFLTRNYLLEIRTPSMMVKFVHAIDTRPWANPTPHLPSPHLDLEINLMTSSSPIAGWLGETASWAGRECPFMRGCLQAADEAYSVSDLLAHDFSFATFDAATLETRARKLPELTTLLVASSGR